MKIVTIRDVFGIDEGKMRPYAMEAGEVFEDGKYERIELDCVLVHGSFGDDGEDVTVCLERGDYVNVEDE